MLRKNSILFNKLFSLHTGEVRKSLMNPVNIYHLLMVHISWQRFCIIQNQWGKVWLWHEPSKNEEKLLYNYFHSEGKQQGINFISQICTSLKVVSPFQLNKISLESRRRDQAPDLQSLYLFFFRNFPTIVKEFIIHNSNTSAPKLIIKRPNINSKRYENSPLFLASSMNYRPGQKWEWAGRKDLGLTASCQE